MLLLFFTKHHKLYQDDGRDSMFTSGLENGTTPTVNKKCTKCTKYFTIEKDDPILICDICDIVATSPSPPQSQTSPTKEFA